VHHPAVHRLDVDGQRVRGGAEDGGFEQSLHLLGGEVLQTHDRVGYLYASCTLLHRGIAQQT
jgi:hypothetical protein